MLLTFGSILRGDFESHYAITLFDKNSETKKLFFFSFDPFTCFCFKFFNGKYSPKGTREEQKEGGG